jgi:hypothetical protein
MHPGDRAHPASSPHAIGWAARIREWLKYERLDHYPELDRFPRGEALARLNEYEREERAACQPWLRSFHVLMALGMVALVAACFFAGDMAQIGLSLFQVPILIVQFVLYRRLRRRVRARMTMEFGAGRLGTCLECGYDLRGTPGDRCSECGAPITVSK